MLWTIITINIMGEHEKKKRRKNETSVGLMVEDAPKEARGNVVVVGEEDFLSVFHQVAPP
jgi:hypothetical protein